MQSLCEFNDNANEEWETWGKQGLGCITLQCAWASNIGEEEEEETQRGGDASARLQESWGKLPGGRLAVISGLFRGDGR